MQPVEVKAHTKRPGYSEVKNTLTPLNLVTSGRLSVGETLHPNHFLALGMSSSESYEIRIAWRHLGLVNHEDRLTEQCARLARTSDEENRDLLASITRAAYAEVFAFLPFPAHVTNLDLEMVFQRSGYQPRGMYPKMISLFRGLCRGSTIWASETEAIAQALVERKLRVSIIPQTAQGAARREEIKLFLAKLLSFRTYAAWSEVDRKWWHAGLELTIHRMMQTTDEVF